MIKFIILASLCAVALGRANAPPPSPGHPPHLNRVARQLKVPDMGQNLEPGMKKPGNPVENLTNNMDSPMGMLKNGQNMNNEASPGRKRRSNSNLRELNNNNAPKISSSSNNGI